MAPYRDGWSMREDLREELLKSDAFAGTPYEALSVWTKGDDMMAIINRHPFGREDDVRWHISVSRPDRVPNWDEMVNAAHALRPGVPFCMGVPPETWWMSVHPTVLHLWETRDDGLIAEWRRNIGIVPKTVER